MSAATCQRCARPIQVDRLNGKPNAHRAYCVGVATCLRETSPPTPASYAADLITRSETARPGFAADLYRGDELAADRAYLRAISAATGDRPTDELSELTDGRR